MGDIMVEVTHKKIENVLIQVDSAQSGRRLDTLVSEEIPSFSRSFFKKLITEGYISVNGSKISKSGHSLRLGDQVLVAFPAPPKPVDIKEVDKNIKVDVVFEHSDFLIISKPAGLIVHSPHSEYTDVTLVDWLTYHFKDISSVGVTGRAGIVHRLDMQTSGLMVIPRNNISHAIFTDMFKDRTIKKTYLAVVKGHPDKTGIVSHAIVRHPVHRNKMTHVCTHELSKSWAKRARASQTNYELKTYYEDFSLVEAKPVTGRTHQIRVHMASIGHVLIGDSVYGSKSPLIGRQALHAYRLEFTYKGEAFSFVGEPPVDFKTLIDSANKPS